jgi:hypothetical protein
MLLVVLSIIYTLIQEREKRMPATVDTLLNTPPQAGVKRVGDIGKAAPYVMLRCDGVDMVLQMPVLVQSRNTIIWNQKDFTPSSFTGSAALDVVKNAKDSDNTSGLSAAKELFKGMGLDFVKKSATGVGSLVGVDSAGDLALHKNGRVVNSNKELMFEGMGYRNFVFEWEFIATNKSEATSINEFIFYTQYFSSPGLGGGGNTYFNYPNQWEIYFYPENYLPTIMPAFITDYAINYGGVGKMVFHEEGIPVGVNVQITFTEAELHIKSKMDGSEGCRYWG